jgi:hypothetical protein
MRMQTGLIWLSIGPKGGLAYITQYWIFYAIARSVYRLDTDLDDRGVGVRIPVGRSTFTLS